MTGETLTMEGTFAADAMVQFPGGVMQSAVVLGEHRATVVVPETATAGDLTVTTGGVTVGPLPFRRTSFALGLQPFRVSYEQTNGARQSPSLRVARSSATSVVINGWLYVVGGDSDSGPVNSIERAPTNADGTLGPFEIVSDVSLFDARSGHTSIVIGSSIFVIGGSGKSAVLSNVERASLNTDGSLGRFVPLQDTALVTGRSGHTSVIIGNFVYVIGGTRNDGAKLASIERATIMPDGSLGPFTTIEVTLTTARSDQAIEIIGNALYVIGGQAAGNLPSAAVERATINADGSLGAFGVAPGVALALARGGHSAAVLGGNIYAIGGLSPSGSTGSVEKAPIGPDGSVGPFAPVSDTALSIARTAFTTEMIGTWIYAIGGRSAGNPVTTIDRASINTDSALEAFKETNIALVLSRVHDTSAVIRDSVYVIGASGSENTIERARIRPDGALDNFASTTTNALVTNRTEHTIAIIGNFLYVIGGASPGAGRISSIERAAINSDGSLGPFAAVSTVLTGPRSGHVGVTVGDFLYVIGGFGTTARLASVERATISQSGDLGPFATVSGVALNVPRNFFSVVMTDRYLYVMGGLDDAGGTAGAERALINTDGSLGPFTMIASSSLIFPRIAHSNMLVGNALYVIGGLFNGNNVSNVEQTTINGDGSLGSFIEVPQNKLTATRARHTAITVSNETYLIGGVTMLPDGETPTVLQVETATLR